MAERLSDLYCCPVTHVPLTALDPRRRELLNLAIRRGEIRDGEGPRREPLSAGLMTRDGQRVYPIEDGIPNLLPEAGIPTHQVAGFEA
ncbi:MAG: Trm112 family protein [Xanthomonadales bacterium]|jgi:uncharacterized protein YbaR (Trm112 family)|nr:Trm112 family protein [Xanthomonadales bacterium]